MRRYLTDMALLLAFSLAAVLLNGIANALQ